jgi:hypothetical protein
MHHLVIWVMIVDVLPLEAEALQPGSCVVRRSAELARSQRSPLSPLVCVAGGGLRVVRSPLVHEVIGTNLAKVVLTRNVSRPNS